MYAKLIEPTGMSNSDVAPGGSCWFYGRTPEGGICVIGLEPIKIPEA